MKLAGKVAIVTGSSLSIGRAIALGLAAEGASVVVNARGSSGEREGATEQVVEQIRAAGGHAIGVAGSVADRAFCADLVARCIAEFGRIDILVNNAGIMPEAAMHPVADCPVDDWNTTLSVNLGGVFNMASAVLPHMVAQRSGRMVNAGSWAGFGGMGGSAYVASKAAIIGLTRAMAADYGPYGITVNCYNPEALSTMGGNVDPAVLEAMLRKWEIKGWRTPAENAYLAGLGGPEGVAPWVVYLCTEQAANLNGLVFAVEARRVALVAAPDEVRVLLRDAARHGPWSQAELAAMALLAFPLDNRWPLRCGETLTEWETA